MSAPRQTGERTAFAVLATGALAWFVAMVANLAIDVLRL